MLLVLAVAVALRFPATQRGFFHWDEAQYLFAVQPGVLTIRAALDIQNWPRPFAERYPFDTEKVPYWAFSAKPGYDLIATLYGVIMGLTPESIGFLSLLFGVGTIPVVYAIARSVFDERVALASAVVLCVSSYHVHYSGSQSSVVLSAFFLTLAVYFYLGTLTQPSFGRLALAGAALAFGYGAHYNLLLYVLVIFAFHVFRLLYDYRPNHVKGLVVLGGSFLAGIGLFELFYRIMIPVAYSHVPTVRGTYLAQLRYHMGVLKWVLPSGIERFPRLLLDSEGPLVCGLAVIGWAGTIIRNRGDWRKGLLLLLVGAHVASATIGGALKTVIFPRMTVAILPFLAIFAGVALIHAVEALNRKVTIPTRVPVFWIGLLLVAMVGSPRAWTLATLQSGHEQQAQYVLEHGSGQQVGLGLPIEQYYLSSYQGTYTVPTTLEALYALYEKTGVRLLVLDYRVNVLEEWGVPLGSALRDFERTAHPEAVIPNAIGNQLVVVGEDAMSKQALARIFADPLSSTIRFYDLKQVFESRERRSKVADTTKFASK